MPSKHRVIIRITSIDNDLGSLVSTQLVFAASQSAILDALQMVLGNFPQSDDSATEINKATKK